MEELSRPKNLQGFFCTVAIPWERAGWVGINTIIFDRTLAQQNDEIEYYVKLFYSIYIN